MKKVGLQNRDDHEILMFKLKGFKRVKKGDIYIYIYIIYIYIYIYIKGFLHGDSIGYGEISHLPCNRRNAT
jgi:hypothetical protein